MSCNPIKFPGGEGGLSGCMVKIGTGCAGGLRLPEDGHVLAPWVSVTFEGSGSVITVGNDSSPATSPINSAVIKSFEYGSKDGMTVRMTIHDEQGGSFVRFMENMLKHYACLKSGSPATVRMRFTFGWAKAVCSGDMPVASSPCYYCLCDSVETNFSGGKFMFEITGKDLCHRMFEGGGSGIYGGLGKDAVPITQAIRDFMTRGCAPNVGSVRFCKMQGGTCQEVEFEDGGKEGPKGKWIVQGQDKLRACMRWLEGHRTKDKLSLIPQYNSEVPNGEVIFWEDRKPKGAKPDSYWDENCLGTYVVNGGAKSPVIEFNPKIRWDFSRLASVGGGSSSERVNAMGTPGSKNPGLEVSEIDSNGDPCAGQLVQTTPTETNKDLKGWEAIVAIAKANSESMRALKVLHDNVEAELVVVGDPTILPPSQAMWSKNVAIVMINPYFLTQSGSGCGEWMAQPVCNEVLSNKAWICMSITHKIDLGKYTTTIGVYLTAPGVDMPPDTPLGGWSGGWVPPKAC